MFHSREAITGECESLLLHKKRAKETLLRPFIHSGSGNYFNSNPHPGSVFITIFMHSTAAPEAPLPRLS